MWFEIRLKRQTDQGTWDLKSLVWDSIYPRGNEEQMKNFKQRCDMNRFAFLKAVI